MINNDYGMAERQKELLQFVKEVNQIMERNGIKYSLCGGTLLGAIRHNGFIPWDDDLDIMLDRKNYNRLLALFKAKRNSVSYPDLSAKYTLKRILWIYRIQKNGDHRDRLTAATVDIMVMDNCPDNLFMRNVKVFLIKMLQGMMHEKLEVSDKTLFMKFCLVSTYGIGKLFTEKFKFHMYDCISQIGKRTRFITGYNDLFKTLNCRYTCKLMDKIIHHPFEDTTLPITAEYDNYLTTQYGDYMTPPPVEERIPTHIYN